jgi:hypothetical protein
MPDYELKYKYNLLTLSLYMSIVVDEHRIEITSETGSGDIVVDRLG